MRGHFSKDRRPCSLVNRTGAIGGKCFRSAAKQAVDQKASVMKDRRTARGGAKNLMRKDLDEAE